MSSLGKFMAGAGEESGLQSLLYVRPQACHCFAPCRNSCLALGLHLLHGTQVSTTRRQRSSLHSGHCDWFPEWIYLCFSFAVENHISTANYDRRIHWWWNLTQFLICIKQIDQSGWRNWARWPTTMAIRRSNPWWCCPCPNIQNIQAREK